MRCPPRIVALIWLTIIAMAVLPAPLHAQATSTLKMDVKVPITLDVTLDTEGARAMVVAKLNEDKPTGQYAAWRCRLIHADPNKLATDPYEVHVDPGALLVLTNLSDEDVTFAFGAELFVERGNVFKVGANSVKILSLRRGIEVTGGKSSEITLDSPCLTTLPGPKIYVP